MRNPPRRSPRGHRRLARSWLVSQVTLALIMTFVATALVASKLSAHSGGVVESYQIFAGLDMDGELSEPEWERAFALNSPLNDIVIDPQDWYQIKEFSGANTNTHGLRVSRGTIDDDDDFSVRWAALWDEEYLYFGIEVTDESVHVLEGPYSARDARNFEGVWLLFDLLHDAPEMEFPEHQFDTGAVAAVSTYAADDVFWLFPLVTGEGRAPSGAAFLGSGETEDFLLNDPANEHVITRITATGYTAEVRIPLELFEPNLGGEPLEPDIDLLIGFDITLMDVDGEPPGEGPGTYAEGTGGAMAWSSDFECDNSPGVLGDLIFSEFPPSEGTAFRRGDVDGNGMLEVTDAVNSLGFQFLGSFQPPCVDALDWDDNGQVELTDAIGNLLRQFAGGPPAPAPGSESCGVDPTDDDGLDCQSSPGCTN